MIKGLAALCFAAMAGITTHVGDYGWTVFFGLASVLLVLVENE